jgi:hypothetical protein
VFRAAEQLEQHLSGGVKMKISRLAAAVALAAAFAANTAPAIASTPDNQYQDGVTTVPDNQYQAEATGNLTSTAGSLDPYADSSGLFKWGGPNSLTAVTMTVKPIDSRCDGLKIGIRLVTIPYRGAKHYWPWHGYTTGCGRTFTYNTYANDSNGIHYATVELGLFNGGTLKGTREAPLSRRPTA